MFSLRNYFFRWGTKFFDYTKKPVRDFLVSSAAYWVDQMHIDCLRVDAIHPILCSENVESAKLFLKQLNAVIHSEFPGVQTIAEDYSGQLAVTQPFYADGFGFDMKWNIAWMKHALEFFAVPPERRNAAYQRMIKAIECDANHKMVLAISHDEVKKECRPLLKMTPGLSDAQELSNLRSFLGMMYAVPGKKLLFMGCDTATEDMWDTLIGQGVGVDDKILTESKKKLSLVMHDLNELYHQPAFYEHDANSRDLQWIENNDHDGRVIAFRRTSKDQHQAYACLQNFTADSVPEYTIKLQEPIPAGQSVPVVEVFNSEDKKYDGSGLTNAEIVIVRDETGAAVAYKVRIPPMCSLIIQEPLILPPKPVPVEKGVSKASSPIKKVMERVRKKIETATGMGVEGVGPFFEKVKERVQSLPRKKKQIGK